MLWCPWPPLQRHKKPTMAHFSNKNNQREMSNIQTSQERKISIICTSLFIKWWTVKVLFLSYNLGSKHITAKSGNTSPNSHLHPFFSSVFVSCCSCSCSCWRRWSPCPAFWRPAPGTGWRSPAWGSAKGQRRSIGRSFDQTRSIPRLTRKMRMRRGQRKLSQRLVEGQLLLECPQTSGHLEKR